MSMRVLHPGTFSLLVDRGRPGARSLGIPQGGAADRAAHAIGNALAGNPIDAVALEISLSGPTLLAEQDVSACLFGAPFDCAIDGRRIAPGALFHLPAGATLKIGAAERGARAYLCVRGGFTAPMVLESGSAFTPIATGEQLVCPPATATGRSIDAADINSLLEEALPANSIRVIDGPQADWFPLAGFFEQVFTVAPASNRMGVRLQGKPLSRPAREMVSEAVAPGAVQITNDGLPIILGVDGQTIGGYPKIAHVIRADLDRIAQLRPGQTVRFTRIGLDEAEAIGREHDRRLRRWLTALRLAAQG